MKKWVIALLSVVLVIVIVVGVVAIKTVTFTSKQVPVSGKVAYPVDVSRAAERLSGAIRCKTVSSQDSSEIDYEQFRVLQEYLEKAFPLVHSTLDKKVINEYSLLYVWKGTDTQKKPILLLAHQDVVPADDEGWKYPPFSSTVADGYIWGRGTLDDKSAICGPMEAIEYLIKDGFKPSRSIYLAFGHDEEIGGSDGAGKIAEYFKSQGLQFEYVLDEGLVVTQGIVPGVSAPAALVGTAEKGYLTLELIAEGEGGHSAMPPRQTAVGILAAAIDKLQNNPFPIRMSGPTNDLFEYLGPEMKFPNNMIFANMWLFGPVVKGKLSASPATNATIRTTMAPTMFQGSTKENVLPTQAKAAINFRLLPGDTIQSVTERVKAVINDPRVIVQGTAHPGVEPSPISSIDTWSFGIMSKTIRDVMPDVVVAPSLAVVATDCKYYVVLSPSIYRFLPQRLSGEDLPRIHGLNERISIENYHEFINFYIQLMRNSCN
jgi:carboxypeptidase PM20D1